jgi:hypothetical protein
MSVACSAGTGRGAGLIPMAAVSFLAVVVAAASVGSVVHDASGRAPGLVAQGPAAPSAGLRSAALAGAGVGLQSAFSAAVGSRDRQFAVVRSGDGLLARGGGPR